MTIPAWPTDLPRPLRAGWTGTLPDGRASTRPETGLPRARRRHSSAASTRQMTIDVSADGRARFWRFWREDTASGSLPFAIPDWTTDGVALTSTDGDDLTSGGEVLTITAVDLVLFGTEQPPSESPIGNRWRIVFQLMVMP